MLIFAYFLLKMTICSGILYGYYLIALRDKIFHKWNRFYLLAAVVLSLVAPLIKINIWQKADEPKTQVIHFLQVVSANDEIVYEYTKTNNLFRINASELPVFIYVVISCFFLAFLIRTLYKINRLKHRYQQTVLEGINFINTDVNGTPFSFFNNIFWNNKIDINTSTGKKIFQHELAHVQEKHSHDKVFINIILIFFWANPIFWLIRKELNMIHEFIADKQALEDSDTAAFAAMILQATYPQQQFNITNNFFYSPLKRRLIMLTKNKNLKISYLSRILVLPLAALVFFAFTLKTKTLSSVNHYTGKKITVIIDAGHGGVDDGAKSENGIYEKNLTLSIAKKIRDLNSNKNLNIVLSRDKDETITPKQRVDLAKSLHADLFISIHLDAEINKNTNSGLGILIPGDDNAHLKESKLLGSYINESFKNKYQLPIGNDLKQPEKGVWTLKANQCPSVIVEPGFLSTQTDIDYLVQQENQRTIARNILNGIEKYAQQNLLIKSDNIPAIQDTVSIDKSFQNRPLMGAIFIDTKSHIWLTADTFIYTTEPSKTHVNVTKAILIVNAKIEGNDILKNKTIVTKKLTIHSGDEEKMLHKYGEAAKNGVFVFEDASIINKPPYYPDSTTLKKHYYEVIADKPPFYPNTKTSRKHDDKIFTKVETEAKFPGGQQVWLKYIQNIIQQHADLIIKDNNQGICLVQFIVDTSGNVSDVKATTMENTRLAEIAVNAIKKGPKWKTCHAKWSPCYFL